MVNISSIVINEKGEFLVCKDDKNNQHYFPAVKDKKVYCKSLIEDTCKISDIKLLFVDEAEFIDFNPESAIWINQDELNRDTVSESSKEIAIEIKVINNTWSGSVEKFLQLDIGLWITEMEYKYCLLCKELPSPQQVKAWRECFEVLSEQLGALVKEDTCRKEWSLIFEYVLPREGGRRPDVLLIAENILVVFEFKTAYKELDEEILQAELDQVDNYARDLQNYHKESHDLVVIPVLLPTGKPDSNTDRGYDVKGNIRIFSESSIFQQLRKIRKSEKKGNLETWLSSTYEPLPSIVEAARDIFNNKELPNIRNINMDQMKELMSSLEKIAIDARAKQEKHIIFLTGVPGSGKTLVGLDFVYNHRLITASTEYNSLYISGNNALIDVLQAYIDKDKSKTFICRLKDYKKEYKNNSNVPLENIIVFDEGQRAWQDEPEFLAQVAKKECSQSDETKRWCCILILVGEGQEIKTGESEDLSKWGKILDEGWHVHGTTKVTSRLEINHNTNIEVDERYELKASIRGHLAVKFYDWVESLLNGDIYKCRKLATEIIPKFKMYMTRDLNVAQEFCRNLYSKDGSNFKDKRYGMVASSDARILDKFFDLYPKRGVKDIGKWYVSDPTDPESSCSFREQANEFQCQGLELDMPIICWDIDMYWDNNRSWDSYINDNNAEELKKYRKNAYRVLLTRGRDGFVIYVPDIREKIIKEKLTENQIRWLNKVVAPQLDGVFHKLKESGVIELE